MSEDGFDEVKWDEDRVAFEDAVVAAAINLFNHMGCSVFTCPLKGGMELKVAISEATN